MCERCANIDYPIGDVIWLPCGGPASRYRRRNEARGYSDADGDGWARVGELVAHLNAQREELERLRESHRPAVAPGVSFEGVE